MILINNLLFVLIYINSDGKVNCHYNNDNVRKRNSRPGVSKRDVGWGWGGGGCCSLFLRSSCSLENGF